MYDEDDLLHGGGERHEAAECPVCKSDTFLQPDLKLLVSPCYHKMCSSCVERIYGHGAKSCPACRKVLRRYDFKEQTFEHLGVEKEVDIRKRVMKYLQRDETAFQEKPDDPPEVVLRRYNDYLEELEDIVFNLANGIEVAAMNEKIEQYRKQFDPQAAYLYRFNHAAATAASQKPTDANASAMEEPFFVDPVLDALFLERYREQKEAHDRVVAQRTSYVQCRDDTYKFAEDPRVRAGGFKADWYWQRAMEAAGPIGGLYLSFESSETQQATAVR